jgi:hypothetical protein
MDSRMPLVNELVTVPDNVEVIRDQIAAILSLEIQNQSALARKAALPDYKGDFDIPVYVENGRPYEASGEMPLMRFMNVLLPKVAVPQTNPRTGGQKEKATFYVDCAACGNDSGSFRDDKSASIRAWKVCRLARRILTADAYMYLGMRGIVGSRTIVSMEAGSPDDRQESESAYEYAVIRIMLEVTFVERSIETRGEILEGIDFEIDPENGQLTAGNAAETN